MYFTVSIEEASLELEHALSGMNFMTKKPSDLSKPNAATTYLKAQDATRSANLTVPSTSQERARMVAATRLRVEQRKDRLQKAATKASEQLAKPIKAPEIISQMKIPVTELSTPGVVPSQHQLPLASSGINNSNIIKQQQLQQIYGAPVLPKTNIAKGTQGPQQESRKLLNIVPKSKDSNSGSTTTSAPPPGGGSTNPSLSPTGVRRSSATPNNSKNDTISSQAFETLQHIVQDQQQLMQTTQDAVLATARSAESIAHSIQQQYTKNQKQQYHNENSMDNEIVIPVTVTQHKSVSSSLAYSSSSTLPSGSNTTVKRLVDHHPNIRSSSNMDTQDIIVPVTIKPRSARPIEKKVFTKDGPTPEPVVSSSSSSTVSSQELVTVLQSMWQDVMNFLVVQQQRQQDMIMAVPPSPPIQSSSTEIVPSSSDSISDEFIMSALTTALVRAEETRSINHARSIRDTLTDVQQLAQRTSHDVLSLQASLRAQDVALTRCENNSERAITIAKETVNDVRSTIQNQLHETDQRLTTSINDLSHQLNTTTAALTKNIQQNEQTITNNSVNQQTTLNTVNTMVQQILQRQVEPSMGMLSTEISKIKTLVDEEKKNRSKIIEAIQQHQQEDNKAPVTITVPTINTDDFVSHTQLDELLHTIATLQSEIVTLKANQTATSLLNKELMNTESIDDRDDLDIHQNEDDNNDTNFIDENDLLPSLTSSIPTISRVLPQGTFVISRKRSGNHTTLPLSSTVTQLHNLEDMNDLSMGEIIIAGDETIEIGDQVQIIPLVSTMNLQQHPSVVTMKPSSSSTD